MSFQFRRIKIKDWLVYGGETEIAFSQFEEGRNLIVINGQNGFGKTSLLQALDYVFRGKLSKAELTEKWNEQARKRREGSLEVAIEFVHADRMCKIVRGADFRPWRDSAACTPRVSLYMDGEVQDQAEDKIEQILPRDCLDFIFFDGAEISKYAQKHEADGVRNSIEKMLGIPAVRNLRDDTNALIRQLEKEQEELLSSTEDAQRLLQEIDDLKVEEENYIGRRKETLEKKTALARTLQQLSAEAQGVEAIERERQDLERKKRRLADLNERKEGLDQEIRTAISGAPLYLMADPMAQIVEELRAKQAPSDRRDKQRARMTVIRDILEEAKCICGQDVDDKLRQKLQIESSRLNELLGSERSRETSEELIDLQAILHTIRNKKIDGEALINQLAAVNTQIEEGETDIGRLQQELEGHDEVTVRELYQQIGSIEQQVKELDAAIETSGKNLSRVAKERELKQRDLDGVGLADDKARGITCVLEECRKVYEAVADLVDRLTEEKRASIENEATEIFRRITNKPQEYDRLRVKDNYALEVVRKDGSAIENEKLSAGEKEVVAYSFITGLNLSSVDPAPFVMDTPFGHLDSGHRRGLLQSLPKLQVQVFLLATDRDLPASERDAIDGSIANEFTLCRDQANAITKIEEA
jgi:DNA sulfur modification protein DndD